MRRFFLLFVFLIGNLYAYEHQTHLILQENFYNTNKEETQFSGNTEFEFETGNLTSKIDIAYLLNSKFDKRYIFINELFTRYEHNEYSFTWGRVVKYWGVMEGFNLADVFNQKNYLNDFFDKSKKIGSYTFLASRYFANNQLELGIRTYEQNQQMPQKNSPFALYPLEYNDELQLEKSRWRPTVHLNFNWSLEDSMDSEVKFIFQTGYDNKRYALPSEEKILSQHAYLANKYMLLFGNTLYGGINFKLEAAYTDVKNDVYMSDYMQASAGLEKGFTFDATTVSLFAEYYYYGYKSKKMKNVDISELYNNDLFLATKINMNNFMNSEFKAGLLYDLDNHEQVLKLDMSTRVNQNIFAMEFVKIQSAEEGLLSNFIDSTRVKLSITSIF